jgi:hypothetical protein
MCILYNTTWPQQMMQCQKLTQKTVHDSMAVYSFEESVFFLKSEKGGGKLANELFTDGGGITYKTQAELPTDLLVRSQS